jgi:hypothetical protein
MAGSFHLESVAGFAWNQWQACCGISGRIRVESVAAFAWNTHAYSHIFCYKGMALIDLRIGSCFGRPKMAVAVTKPWDAAVEKTTRDFYDTLSEKDRRRFAAVQARQLGYGGVRYVAAVLGCSRRTIERGFAELDDLPHDPAAGQVRRPGAGRKKSPA